MTYSPLALLARGEARFTGDLPLPPGTLHAMVAVSPQAHARFSGIDRSAALAEPGVVAVLTAADIPGTNDIGNLFRGEPLLAVEEVHCVGEPYALVVADSADAAWRGAQKLRADWQPLPAIFEVRAAYALALSRFPGSDHLQKKAALFEQGAAPDEVEPPPEDAP